MKQYCCKKIHMKQHFEDGSFPSIIHLILKTKSLLQSDREMASLLCAYDTSGQGSLSYHAFIRSVLESTTAHPSLHQVMSPASESPQIYCVNHRPLQADLLTKAPHGTAQSPETDAKLTKLKVHEIRVAPVLASIERCVDLAIASVG